MYPEQIFPENTVVTFDRSDIDIGGYSYRVLDMDEVEEVGWDSRGYNLLAIGHKDSQKIAMHFQLPYKKFPWENLVTINGEKHFVLNQYDFEHTDFDPFKTKFCLFDYMVAIAQNFWKTHPHLEPLSMDESLIAGNFTNEKERKWQKRFTRLWDMMEQRHNERRWGK